MKSANSQQNLHLTDGNAQNWVTDQHTHTHLLLPPFYLLNL